jgi:hypothetical protein
VGDILHLGAQNRSAYAQILSNTNFEHKGPLVYASDFYEV